MAFILIADSLIKLNREVKADRFSSLRFDTPHVKMMLRLTDVFIIK